VRPVPQELPSVLADLLRHGLAGNDADCVHALKRIIPEYRSQNSVYATFDPPTAGKA
jgi:hypothetical protein